MPPIKTESSILTADNSASSTLPVLAETEIEPVTEPVSTSDLEIQGLTQEEISDPNAIIVTITDKETPIVVLFGPPACGKTMTLVRLARYLRTNEYKIVPVGNFRPTTDSHYKQMCEKFPAMIDSLEAAASTSGISFMLVRVLDKNSKVICQLLEAPGEYYYNPNDNKEPDVNFPRFVNAITNSENRKIWCYMVEPDWIYRSQAERYVDKIKKMKKNMKSKDKAVFICNKVDTTDFVVARGKVNTRSLRKEVEELYPGIFTSFRSKSLLFGYTDNFVFVPFQTGNYNPLIAGGQSFEVGPDEYPAKLWNTILKIVKG